MLVNILETSLYFFYYFLHFYMYVLIVTGSDIRKVNKLMLVQSASVVPSGCTPYTCNITWANVSA